MILKFDCSNVGFLFFTVFAVCLFSSWNMAQNKPCEFNEKTLQFVGTPVEQARCLLRPNKIGGVLDQPLKNLPRPLEDLIGQAVVIKKESLRKFLTKHKIDEETIGGNLDKSLANIERDSPSQLSLLVAQKISTPYRPESYRP